MTAIITEHKVNKRGRPRKYRAENMDQTSTATATTKPATVYEEKPREERSYKDFFPTLNIKEPLSIVKVNNSFDLHYTVGDPVTSSEVKPLPVASFEKKASSPARKEAFERPANEYIRYVEPTEKELFDVVEYDMDEQDQVWLQIYNRERKKENLGIVSYDLFESIIDQLEKEWFDLVKSLPKKVPIDTSFPEDSKCAICDDGECENSNAIVFCDGCNLAVHQDCYGIPYIPEGQWLCRKCMVSPENPVSCIFCPAEGGAFKQTTRNTWGHLLCAIWIPEVNLSNSVYMEPIDENIPKSRWRLNCYICRKKMGACIQCDNKHCFTAFHVSCARWARLCMRMKLHGTHYDNVVLKAYCEKHTPKDYKEQVDVDKSLESAQRWFHKYPHDMPKKKTVDEENRTMISGSNKSTSNSKAKNDIYLIAPEYILDKIEKKNNQALKKMKNKSQVVTTICRYWSLKRYSRRGAPLLKRLHLEPWTASSNELKQNELEKAHKASFLIKLRADIETIRILSEQVQKRERLKMEKIRKQKKYLEMILYPTEFIIKPILDQCIELDKKELFRYPVTKELALDYYDIIKEPMSFQDIIEKLSNHLYLTLDEFKHDVLLIFTNSMTYNKSDTPYYKLAEKLLKTTEQLLIVAYKQQLNFCINRFSGLLDTPIDFDIFSYGDDKDIKPMDITAMENEITAEISLSDHSVHSDDTVDIEEIEETKGIIEKVQVQQVVTTRNNKRVYGETKENVSTKRIKVTTKEKSPPRVTRSKSKGEKKILRSRSIAIKSTLGTEEKTVKKLDVNDKLVIQHDELVWARVRGFPPHPARIVDPKKRKKIPRNVLDLAQNSDKVLVEFLQVGETHQWGWIERNDLFIFGKPENDIEMLKLAKKTKKSHRIQEVRRGFVAACELFGIDPHVAMAAVFKYITPKVK